MSNDPPFATPRDAASVILVRPRTPSGELEVFLLRRHRKAKFMSSAFVFPGGIADPGDDDLRATAARELFEEAGVLISDRAIDGAKRADWRQKVNEDGADLGALLAAADAHLDLAKLHYYAHWITPSIERHRYSAMFYIAELPAGQTPHFDNRETVDEVWVTPAEALARAAELRLPPPQVRTFHELGAAAERGTDALFALAAERAEHPHPVMPRMCPLDGGGFALTLPWDPDYVTGGQGDLCEIPADHPLAVGPSRFVLEEMAWKHIYHPKAASPAEA